MARFTAQTISNLKSRLPGGGWLTLREYAKQIGVDVPAVEYQMNCGTVKYKRVAGFAFIHQSEPFYLSRSKHFHRPSEHHLTILEYAAKHKVSYTAVNNALGRNDIQCVRRRGLRYVDERHILPLVARRLAKLAAGG